MDSISNLPLLEIAAEDDSLLLDAVDDAITSASTSSAAASTVFACSPLLSLRSLLRTDGRVGALDSENAISATKEATNRNNKENLNWNNKPEAPNLSVEPQQMKRKKKGGGYNLRKSLAWDRAFFTEEGVLNPMELSMISGTATPKRTNNIELKAIYEEEPGSASLALQEMEENLFKQSSDGGACLEDRNNGAAGLSPKSGASTKIRVPPSLAKRKVLAVNDVVGNVSKRNACPRPVAPSSFESAKAPKKESKVSKIPGPKSNVSGITTAARSGTFSTGLPKRNHSAHPATNVQKYAGAKGLSKKPITASTNPKVDTASKCSISRTFKKQAEKHLDSSLSAALPPRLHLSGTGAQKVLEACLSQGVSATGEKKQPRLLQTSKPSGLRMPSPSLGFFSQAKTPSSQSQLQKSSCKPPESNIPKLRKLDTHSVNEAKLPPAPRKRCETVEVETNNCTKKLSLSDVQSEASMQLGDDQIAGVEAECDSLDFEKISKQEMVDIKQTAGLAAEFHSLGLENPSGHILHTVLGGSIQGIPYKNVEQINDSAGDFGKLGGDSQAHLFNGNLSVNCNDPPIQSTFKVVSQQLHGDLSIVEEISSENENENESQGNNCKLVHVTTLSSKCSPEKSTPEINRACESDPKVAESEDCQHPVDDQSAFIQSSSVDDGCHQVMDAKGLHNRTLALELDRMYEDSTAVHVTTLSSECSPEKPTSEMVSACESDPKIAESEDCQHPVDGQLGFIQRRSVDEGCDKVIDSKVMHNKAQAFEFDRTCEDSTVVHVTTLSFKCSPEKPIPEMDGVCESEPLVVENEDRKHPGDEGCVRVIYSYGMQNRTEAFELGRMSEDSTAIRVTTLSSECSPTEPTSEMVGASEIESEVAESEYCQHPVDDQLDFSQRRPVDEGCDKGIGSKGMHNRTQAFELDRMCEDSTAVHLTNLSYKCSHEKSILEINGASESETKVAESKDCQHTVDQPSDFIERRPVDESYQQDIDSEGMNNKTKAFESDRMCEDSLAVSATVCRTEVNNVSPESRSFYENNTRNLHFPDQLCPMVKADDDSIGNDMLIGNHCTISEWQLRGDGSCRGSSIPCAVQCDVLGNIVQQVNTLSEWQYREDVSSMNTLMYSDVHSDVPENLEQQADSRTHSETNEMICEDENLAANHGLLLDESEYSGVTVDFISNTEDSICGGSENPSGLLQHTVLAQSVRELYQTNRESEESYVGDEQAQSILENPVMYKYENDQCLSATNDQFPLVGDKDKNDEFHLSELQRPVVFGGENSQHVSNIMHLDGDRLPANTAYSKENKQKYSFEGASEGCDIYSSDYNASNHHMQSMPRPTDGNLDVHERVEMQISDVKNGCSTNILPWVEVELNHEVISADFDSPIKMSEDRTAEVVNSKLPASNDLTFHTSTPQGSEVSSLNNNKFSQEPETNIFEKDEFPNTDVQHQTQGDLCSEEDSSKLTHLEKSATESKPEVPSVKLPPNAVPFSDEWLAAIEAAGEEILTMKGGAVQNSPTEKPQHEPGPWSPVKRKNQTIGPFDCTKHTNIPPHNSS